MKIANFYAVNCLSILFILLLQVEGSFWSDLFGDTEPQLGPDESDRRNITCSVIEDCTPNINGSICADGFCECPEDMPVFVNATPMFETSYCLPVFNVTNGNCSFSQQCQYENGECVERTCQCAEKFTPNDGKCKLEEKTAMIPIIVGSVIGAGILFTLIAYAIMSRKKDVS